MSIGRKEKFYQVYGRHMLLIEITLILTLTSIFMLQNLLPPNIGSLLFGIWLVASIVSCFIHQFVFLKIAHLELHPYGTLRLERFRSYFVKIIIFLFFLSFVLIYVVSNLFPTFQHKTLVLEILGYFMLIVLPMLAVALVVNLQSISDYKRARLSFKTVLNAIKLIRKEKKPDRKMKLIKKRVRWFREGLHSFNSYLYSKKPTHFQIVDVDQYHLTVCSVALIGKRTEMDTIVKQIRLALSSTGKRKDDFRHFLIALKNLKNMKNMKEYSLSELNEMITILSFSERVKERLKSPYVSILTSVIIGIVAIVFELIHFAWE